MTDPLGSKADMDAALELIGAEVHRFLAGVDTDHVRMPAAAAIVSEFEGGLSEEGVGTLAALRQLARGTEGAIRSTGPRFFHWVHGGSTPAALAADWLASALDQNAFSWESSPIGTQLETTSINLLKDLFGLPKSWGGVLTTGATMANFTGLAAARNWWATQHGVRVDADGFSGLPPVPVFSSGFIHTSATKALAMLGIGRASVQQLSLDDTGRLDLALLERRLVELGGKPSIIVGNAGEVNAGQFDPLAAMADLAKRHHAWLHVDGAFGLFARVTPRAAMLAEGVERAHSVVADGHKWLNVPYDCGFVFVRDVSWLTGPFELSAAYLPTHGVNYGMVGPEASRRARGLAIWATLQAYGRQGYRAMVERHLELAQRLGAQIQAAPDLELLAPVRLNIVCFRVHVRGLSEEQLDLLNRTVGAALLEDARVYAGTTRYDGKAALRAAIVNWRTTETDIDLIVPILHELVEQCAAT